MSIIKHVTLQKKLLLMTFGTTLVLTYLQADMKKLVVRFRNIVNEPIKEYWKANRLDTATYENIKVPIRC